MPDTRAKTTAIDEALAAIEGALARGATIEARGRCRRAMELLIDAAGRASAAGAPDGDEAAASGGAGLGCTACTVMRHEARALLMEGDADAALDVLEAARAAAESAALHRDTALALNGIAIVHYNRGDLDEAERIYHAAHEQAGRADDARVAAPILTNLGVIANIRGDLEQARRYYERSLVAYRSLGLVRELPLGLNNLGMLYVDLGRWGDAERAFTECLAVAEAVGDLDAVARVHVNLAEMWIERGDLRRAQSACDAALAVSGRTPFAATRGEVHKQMGIVARELGNYAAAETHLAEAARIADERHDLLLLAETAKEQADLFGRQGRNRDTLQTLNRAHRLFGQLRARRDLADVGRRMGRLEDEFLDVARRWGESIEAKDRYTQGHCQRVADLACAVARQSGLMDEQTLFWFRIGALLHDVGKLIVPAEVLNKPGKLSDEEFALMRSHTTAGVDLLSGIEFPWDIRPIVESHHERWDGRGYPHGLAGEAIPMAARILAIADVYDALTSVRSYKRALAHDEAVEILRKDVGTQFDTQVFGWFMVVAPGLATRTAAAQASAQAATLAAGESPPPDSVLVPAPRMPGSDEVTGLPLLPMYLAEGERVLAVRRGTDRPVSVLAVRLDLVAATARGPAARDHVLRHVAETLSRNTRGGDFVGRVADDRFVLILPDLETAEVDRAAARIRESVAAHGVRLGSQIGEDLHVQLTIGTARTPADGDTPEALLAAATARARAPRRRGTMRVA